MSDWKLTFPKVLRSLVNNFGSREALVYPKKNQRWTYNEWNNKINKFANALLDLGVEKGNIVSADLFDSSEFATAFLATCKIGAIFNPINFRLASKEVSFILNNAESKILIFEEGTKDTVEKGRESFETVDEYIFTDENEPDFANSFYDMLESQEPDFEAEVEIEESDPHLLMYTSGTTGKPKGVLHSQRDALEFSYISLAGTGINQNWTVSFAGFPLYHSAGMNSVFLPVLVKGCRIILPHHLDPEKILEIVGEEGVNLLAGPPIGWNYLLLALDQADKEYNLSSLKAGAFGGAPMAPSKIKETVEKLGLDDMFAQYGMTEMGPGVTIGTLKDLLEKEGTAGRTITNHEVRVVEIKSDGTTGSPDEVCDPGEEGEIITRGPPMMKKYWKNPEKTDEAIRDGWFYTGDMGFMDEDGYLFYKGRTDDMIMSGGENIHPREVEEPLIEHEDVLEVAVTGAPHEQYGEQVAAFIRTNREDKEDLRKELDSFCKKSEKLADYKRPRKYEFVEELPKLPSGKIQRFKLKEMLSEGSE